MIVSQILSDKGGAVLTVPPDTTAVEAARLMTEKRVGCLVVRRGQGKLEGIISERDVVTAFAGAGADMAERPVSALMTPADRLITCTPTDTIARIMAVMTDRRVRHLPVLDAGRLAGIISIGDIVKARLRETLAEVEAMTAYVRGCVMPVRSPRRSTRGPARPEVDSGRLVASDEITFARISRIT